MKEQNDRFNRIHVGPESVEALAHQKLAAGRSTMGEVRAVMRVESSADRALFEAGQIPEDKIRFKMIDAVVDTGAVMPLLPRDLVEDLGLKTVERVIVHLADDSAVQMDRVGPVRITILTRLTHTDCLVGPPGCEPLIGQVVLESLDLIVDPSRRTLSVRPESPYRPTLKMKALSGS